MNKFRYHLSTMTVFIILTTVFMACEQKAGETNNRPNTTAIATPDTIPVQDTVVKITKPYDSLHYLFVSAKDWVKENKNDSNKMNIVTAINRTDDSHLGRMDSILVPENFSFDIKFYLPFPLQASALRDVNKIVMFSYPAQIFAAYKNGKLVITGPTNMGRKNKPTPTGLFFTNWKAEHSVSTVNDEWDLYWNFNVANRMGVGWHQYSLPGYPVSHSCMRLREPDARYLYSWADQWKLIDNQTIQLKGTPVVIFGEYDFDNSKSWLALANDPKTLEITAGQLKDIIDPYLKEIMQAQEKRIAIEAENKIASIK